jgi:ankyrin repeat protein
LKSYLASVERVIYSPTSPYNQVTSIDELFLAVRKWCEQRDLDDLRSRISTNAHKGDRRVALHVAAERATVEIVLLLINSGADVGLSNASAWTPLHFASRFNSAATISLLLKRDAKVLDLTINDRCTPLHLAAIYNKSVDAIKTVIDAGADINAMEVNEWTPLHLATRHDNRAEVFELLTRRGASARKGIDESYTSLRLVAGHRDTEILNSLLGAEADIEAPYSDGWIPLHKAVRFGREPNVHELLKEGARYHAESNAGILPADVGFANNIPDRTKDSIQSVL